MAEYSHPQSHNLGDRANKQELGTGHSSSGQAGSQGYPESSKKREAVQETSSKLVILQSNSFDKAYVFIYFQKQQKK